MLEYNYSIKIKDTTTGKTYIKKNDYSSDFDSIMLEVNDIINMALLSTNSEIESIKIIKVVI